MKFWDTSALIPLLVEESSSAAVGAVFEADPALVVWWGTSIECLSAISRLEREHSITRKLADDIVAHFNKLRRTWREIQPCERLKHLAERTVRLHPLRAPDAQQLAACLVANLDTAIDIVTLDERLAEAARREGLQVVEIHS